MFPLAEDPLIASVQLQFRAHACSMKLPRCNVDFRDDITNGYTFEVPMRANRAHLMVATLSIILSLFTKCIDHILVLQRHCMNKANISKP